MALNLPLIMLSLSTADFICREEIFSVGTSKKGVLRVIWNSGTVSPPSHLPEKSLIGSSSQPVVRGLQNDEESLPREEEKK